MSNAKNAWQAPVFNFAGIALFDEIDEIQTGNYKAVLTETDYHTKSGETTSTSIIFRARIVEGAETQTENGKVAAKWIGLAVNEGNARGWKAAYVSFGYNPQTLEQAFSPEPKHFQPGKVCYLHIITPPLPEGMKRDAKSITCNFISPQSYAERKAGVSAGAGPGFTPTGPGPGLPAGQAPVNFGAPQQVQQPVQQPVQQIAPPPPTGPSMAGPQQGQGGPGPAPSNVVPIAPLPPNGGGAPGATLFEQPPGAPTPAGGFFGPGPSA